MSKIIKILTFLINKVKATKNDTSDEEDITKNITNIFSIVKIAEKEEDEEALNQMLGVLGLLIKNNFNQVSIDMDTQCNIRRLAVELLNKSKLKELNTEDLKQAPVSKKSIGKILILLGILANQAFLTAEGSFEFF